MNGMYKDGHITAICGPMFSGKTGELIRLIERALIAKLNVVVFKPAADERYSKNSIVTHSGSSVDAISVENVELILKILFEMKPVPDVVAIDEAQFFIQTETDVYGSLYFPVVTLVGELAKSHRRIVYIAGLDMDFRGNPFRPMAELLAIADRVIKLDAICTVCHRPAIYSQRLVNGEPAYYDEPLILIAGEQSYEPRCRQHHEVPVRKRQK